MAKISEVMEALEAVEKKITLERKKGTSRDKVVIKQLRTEHFALTKSLAGLHQDDGATPKDKKDHSGQKHKDRKAAEQKLKQEEFEKKQAEILVIANKNQS